MNKLFLELLNMSLTAGILIVVVAVARHLLQKAPKNVYYVLWAMVAVRLVCPVALESSFSLVPSQIGKVSTRQVGNAFLSKAGLTTEPFVVIWIAGVLIMLGYSTVRYIRLYTRMCTAIRLRDDVWQSEYVITPFVFGFRNPKIYVPYGICEEQLQMVVAHEHAHLRHQDHIIKLIAFVILAVYWFNPLVWLAFVLLCRDIEVACDERVVKHMSRKQRKIYSEALLSLSVSGKSIAACPVCFGEVGVKMRIKKILSYQKSSLFTRANAAIACFLVAICFLSNPETAVVKGKIFPPREKKEVAKDTTGKQNSSASLPIGKDMLTEENTSPEEEDTTVEETVAAVRAEASSQQAAKGSGQEHVREVTASESEEEKNETTEAVTDLPAKPLESDKEEDTTLTQQEEQEEQEESEEPAYEEVTEEDGDEITVIGKGEDTEESEEAESEESSEEESSEEELTDEESEESPEEESAFYDSEEEPEESLGQDE